MSEAETQITITTKKGKMITRVIDKALKKDRQWAANIFLWSLHNGYCFTSGNFDDWIYMSNQTERMRTIAKFLRQDAESIHNLAENAAERGIVDPEQANAWAERFEAAAGQMEAFLEGWSDPRSDPWYRKSTIARAVERDKRRDYNN